MNFIVRDAPTERGFWRTDFCDHDEEACSLQESSAILGNVDQPGAGAVWLGKGRARMHLDRARVAWLIARLQRWLDTGSFREAR